MRNTPQKVIDNTAVGMIVKGYGGLFIVTAVDRKTFEVKIKPMCCGKYDDKALFETFDEYDFKDNEWYK